jgi:hypothetical protein
MLNSWGRSNSPVKISRLTIRPRTNAHGLTTNVMTDDVPAIVHAHQLVRMNATFPDRLAGVFPVPEAEWPTLLHRPADYLEGFLVHILRTGHANIHGRPEILKVNDHFRIQIGGRVWGNLGPRGMRWIVIGPSLDRRNQVVKATCA